MEIKEILNSDVLDIIFEGRNKNYGAYELRKNYKRRATISLISVLIFIALLGSITYVLGMKKPKKEVRLKPKVTQLKQPPVANKKKPPPPPPPPPKKPTVKFTPPVIKKAEEVKKEDIIPPKKELEKAVAAAKTEAGDPNAKIEAITTPEPARPAVVEPPKPVEEPTQIFDYVEQMPEFPGGEDKMLEYIGNNLKYPKQALEQGVDGRVVVNFVVDENGRISDVKTVRGIGSGCDAEAERVVRSMPPWKAGKQNGKAVKVSFSLPILFELQ